MQISEGRHLHELYWVLWFRSHKSEIKVLTILSSYLEVGKNPLPSSLNLLAEFFGSNRQGSLGIILGILPAIQSLSCVQLFVTSWTEAHQASLSITNSQSLLKLMSIQSMMPSKYLILCRPLLLPPSIFPSIRVFSNESVLRIRWPKYWSFSFSISLSNEYSGLISFRMDWLDLLAVQGTLKSLLQFFSAKLSL